MFRDLNTIPWYDLTHAYGSAEEVPMWLRQLASNEEQIRTQAIWHLTGSICHQGWICPATGYAVPFLIELLQQPGVQGKEAILELLADPELQEETWRKNSRVPQWDVPADIPFKDARLEVSKGLPVYQRLLASQEEAIRMSVAHLFTCLPLPEQERRSLLLAAFGQEAAPAVRANLILALGALSQEISEAWNVFAELVTSQEESPLAFCAAIILARLQKQESSEAVAQCLARVFLEQPEALEIYRKFPCGGGAPWLTAGWALTNLGAARLQFLLPSFPALFARAGKWEKYALADLVVAMFFTETTPGLREPRTHADLTELQWNALVLLADQPEIWGLSNFSEQMRAAGLPDSHGALLAFLGREAPLPPRKPLSSSGSVSRQRELLEISRSPILRVSS